MTTYTFDEILGNLPDCDKFPMRMNLPLGVSYVPKEITDFIHPNLSVIEEVGETDNPQVIIVSAPGAVGKSTFGKAIAFIKGAFFWDLASAEEVGSNSLDGMLLNTLESGRIEESWEYMSEGFQFLIIDALDEGRIKVNESALSAAAGERRKTG